MQSCRERKYDSPDRLRAIQKAAAETDLGKLRLEAHALKGASSLMGIHTLAQACAELEQIHSSQDLAQSQAIVRSMEQHLETASRELTELLARYNEPR